MKEKEIAELEASLRDITDGNVNSSDMVEKDTDDVDELDSFISGLEKKSISLSKEVLLRKLAVLKQVMFINSY